MNEKNVVIELRPSYEQKSENLGKSSRWKRGRREFVHDTTSIHLSTDEEDGLARKSL